MNYYTRPRGSKVNNTCKPQNPNKKRSKLNKKLAKLQRRTNTWVENPRSPDHRDSAGHIHHKPGSMK